MGYKIDADGMVRDADGKLVVTPIDGALAQMHSFAGQDALILRLFLQTDAEYGQSNAESGEIATDDVHQFGMSPAVAKRVMGFLAAFLAASQGTGEVLQ